MRVKHTPEMTYDSVRDALAEEFPDYQVTVKKNPLFRFQFVEVRKSSTVGTWIRINEKRGKVTLQNCIPSAFVRAMAGGLLLWLFTVGPQNKLRKASGEALIKRFNSSKA